MNKPTEEQIREVLAGTSTPETARLVAQWFATDEGTDYLSRSMDCDVEQVKLGYEELYKEGVIGIFSSADRAMSFQTALKTACAKLEALAFSVVRLIEGVIKYEENK